MEKETLEEILPKNSNGKYSRNEIEKAFELGIEWQAERMYSRQDLIDFVYFINDRHFNKYKVDADEVDLFIEQFKKI
jgi:hypothetical protein